MTFPHHLLRWPALLALASIITSGQAPAQDQTARLVKDANRSPATHGPGIDWISPAGKGAVFTMDTLEHGPELWTTNGTPKGTRLLKEFIPGPGGIQSYYPITFGSGDAVKTAFTYWEGAIANEVWVTDGTEAGTVRVHQSSTREVYTPGGTPRGFFFYETEPITRENGPLYFSDGTPGGTHALTSATGSITRPYFSFTDGPWAYLGTIDKEIWRSDGTPAGTTKLATSLTPDDDWAIPLAITGGRILVEVSRDPNEGDFPGIQLWTCPQEGGELTRLPVSPTNDKWWFIQQCVSVKGGLCLTGNYYSSEPFVWITDGTAAGTREIVLPFAEGEHGNHIDAAPWGDSIYLSVSRDYPQDSSTHYLFRANADGTGVTRLGTFPHGVKLLPAADWREEEPYFYFHATTSFNNWDLWRTKGDAASTRPAKEVPATHYLRANQNSLVNTVAGKIYAVADQEFAPWRASSPLYRQRGKHGSAQRLTKPEKWTASGTATFYYEEAPGHEMTGKHLLEFVDAGRSQELWRMNPDGTGARALWSPPKPIDPSYGALSFHGTTPGGAIFRYREYSHDDSSSISQLWTSDGTRSGTRLLRDYSEHTEEGASLPENFVQVGTTLFYTVAEYNDLTGTRNYLWKTDGTRDGTTRVWAANGFNPHIEPGEMVSFQGMLYFLTQGANYRSMLWRSDGTSNGTTFVATFYKNGSYATGARGLSVVGGKLLCFADPSSSHQLWQSDGTEDGTHAIDSPIRFWYHELDRPIDVGGFAIFRAREGTTNFIHQWWCYDEANGIRPLREGLTEDQFPRPTHTSEYPWHRSHAATATKLFYATGDGDRYKLWVTDGTSAGTRIVHETALYPSPLDLFPVGDVVYFINHTDTHGRELWRSDGTEEGTVLAADINPGQASSNPEHLKLIDGKLYFTAERRDIGRELFVLDPLAK